MEESKVREKKIAYCKLIAPAYGPAKYHQRSPYVEIWFWGEPGMILDTLVDKPEAPKPWWSELDC